MIAFYHPNMDMETFKTLAEVLAFECKSDVSKYHAFCDVFYGDYNNKGAVDHRYEPEKWTSHRSFPWASDSFVHHVVHMD